LFKSKNAAKSEFGIVKIKCKIDIPKSKQELLNQYFGHSRYIYNWAVDYNKELYEKEGCSLDYVKLQNQLPILKKEPSTAFLKQVDSTCLQQALQDYSEAFKRFLQRKAGYPGHRSKYDNQSCRIININDSVRLENNKIKLGKFGWVITKPLQTMPKGKIQDVTIKRTKTGKVFATLSIRREEAITELPKTGKEVGIDVGVKNFASFSDGIVISKPDFFEKDDKKLRKLHRQLSRKQKGSKNRIKAMQKLAVAYEKDKNRRADFINKLSLQIVRDYDFIAMEHLDVKSMLQDKTTYKDIHKSIQNLGWYSFIKKVEYKADWYGKTFVQVDTYFPSSQLCNHCGFKNTDIKDLKIRKWECPICHTVHDRDLNASNNILSEGKRIISEKCVA
jgi:putative transposase